MYESISIQGWIYISEREWRLDPLFQKPESIERIIIKKSRTQIE